MPENKKRAYSLEVVAEDYSFYRENSIIPPDDQPALAVGRVCCNVIRFWAAGEFKDMREIVIRFIPSKQRV